jgi:hypothetical protein
MASSEPDQAALLKEVLESLNALRLNQIQLTSNVDAIAGRVNVLAGMKEVRDVATEDAEKSPSDVKTRNAESHDHAAIPESPPVIPTEVSMPDVGEASTASHAKKHSLTSRIILT